MRALVLLVEQRAQRVLQVCGLVAEQAARYPGVRAGQHLVGGVRAQGNALQ